MERSLHQQWQALPPDTAFLIGLSGGVDSVVLLHLFTQLRQRYPIKLRAVHVHHGLSPNADQWAAFCQRLCDQWHVPLTIHRVRVTGKQGLEANARAARYQAIRQTIQPQEMLVTAHHLDDQAETVLLALKRGAGVKGLSGMQAVSFQPNLAIFRPLLAHSKATLLAYAKQHQLDWQEDESNANDEMERNFLRHHILPQLNQRWAHFNQMVARASQHCAEQQQLLEELLDSELSPRLDLPNKSLNIQGFTEFSRLKQQQLLRLWLAKCGEPMPSTAQLAQLIAQMIFAERDKNPQLKLGEKVVRRYQQRLFLTEPLPTMLDCTIPVPPLTEQLALPDALGTLTRTADQLIFCKNTREIDRLPLPSALQNQPLTIQFARTGKVKRYGNPQRETMKKIWQQHGVPVWLRHRTPLLFFKDELVGVLV